MNIRDTVKNTFSFLKLLRKGQKHILLILFGASFLTAVSPFISLIYSTRILNLVYEGKQSECVLYVVLMLLLNLIIGLGARTCIQEMEVIKKASYLTVERKTAYKAFTMPYDMFEKTESLDAIRRVKQGEQVGGGVGVQISNLELLLEYFFTILFSLMFVIHLFRVVDYSREDFFSSRTTSVLFIFLYAAILGGTIRFAKYVGKKKNELWREHEHNNSITNYVLSLSSDYKNGKDIRLFGMHNLILSNYNFYSDKYASMYAKWGKLNGVLGGVMILISQIPALLSYIFVIAQVKNQVIQVGDILLYAGAINRLTQAIEQAIVAYNNFAFRMDYLKLYQTFIEEEGYKRLEKKKEEEIIHSHDMEFTFQDVCFRYPDSEQDILQHVNMTIRQGESVALVGQNGAGKTTIVKLLCRFYEPTSGMILLNGKDIREWNQEAYMELFAAVFQDFKLFSFPLGENIAGGTHVKEEKVWEVLEKAGMKESVMRMPDKLNVQLYRQNTDGIEISGGQAQKLAIARALYKERPVVILDEPASALDPFSEAEIYEKFHDVVADKTAIYISHRMSSCKFCDRIIVLENGCIVEEGNHNQLIQNDGLYAKMYNTQAQYYVR